MKPADVTIENRRGVFVLRPETPAGRRWLEANLLGQWRAGELILGVRDLTPIVVAMAEAALEVADAPRYCVQRGRRTANGETVN